MMWWRKQKDIIGCRMTIGQNLKFEDDSENINAIMLTWKQKVFITRTFYDTRSVATVTRDFA